MESRGRASGEQFSTLLEFMESHGDLAKPQPGAQGRLSADRMWQELANTLNSVGGGVRKTPDKWKKVWADWKSKTKKKGLTIRRHESGTGGGPSTHLTLTALESRVLGIIGALAVEGHPEIQEQGFDRPSTAPSTNLPSTSSAHLDLDIGDEDRIVPIPPSSPPQWVPSPEPVTLATPLPSTSRQQRPAATAALRSPPRLPPTRRLPQTAPSPHSSVTSPHRRHLRARRRQAPTPFERATSDFVAIEERRLRLEEMRERNEAQRIEVERERNQLLNRFADIAQALLENYLSRGHLGSTDQLETE